MHVIERAMKVCEDTLEEVLIKSKGSLSVNELSIVGELLDNIKDCCEIKHYRGESDVMSAVRGQAPRA